MENLRNTYLSVIILLIIAVSSCRKPTAPHCIENTWSKTYGGLETDIAYSIEQTVDGGFIIVGYTESYGVRYKDVYLIKTNDVGDTMWTRTFGGIYYEKGYSVQQTSDGGYIVVGTLSGHAFEKTYLIKTNSEGDSLWTKTYDEGSGYSVRQTPDNGYVIGGTTDRTLSGTDAMLIKTDNNGNIQWTKAYGGTYADKGLSLRQTKDGGYIIVGYSSGDILLVKTDSLGDSLWAKTYGNSSFDYGYAVRQTSDGGYIIGASSILYGVLGTSEFCYFVKTDSLGDTVWTRTISDIKFYFENPLQITSDGGYIITGFNPNYSLPDCDVPLVKMDNNGNIEWTEYYGSDYYDGGSAILEVSDGYVITGWTYSNKTSSRDVYLIKVQP